MKKVFLFVSFLLITQITPSFADPEILRSSSEKQMVNYSELEEKCAGASCCLASLDNMKEVKGFLLEDDHCPEGYQPNRLYCINSYQWCEPSRDQEEKSKNFDKISCPMDAKLCGDGSAVGRIPPACKFALCPDEICEKAGGRIQEMKECDGSTSQWCIFSDQEQCYADQVIGGKCSVDINKISPRVLCDNYQ